MGCPPQFLGRSELQLPEGQLAEQKAITVAPHSPKNLLRESDSPIVPQGHSRQITGD